MFDFSNAKFEGCNIQNNAQNGIQNNGSIGNYSTEEIIKICDELKCISDENVLIKETIDEIQSELKNGASRNKILSLLGTLKNAITVVSISTKFPDIVEKVKGMISNIIN